MENYIAQRETMDMAVMFIWLIGLAAAGVYAHWIKVS